MKRMQKSINLLSLFALHIQKKRLVFFLLLLHTAVCVPLHLCVHAVLFSYRNCVACTYKLPYITAIFVVFPFFMVGFPINRLDPFGIFTPRVNETESAVNT